MLLNEIIKELESRKNRSAWERGVNEYAFELCETLEEAMRYKNIEEVPVNTSDLEEVLLNGANNWSHYSWSGCSLVYNYDIAKRLCTPSEFKKCKEGERRPNSHEEWLDTQARALYQAFRRIIRIIKNNNN